MSEIREQAQKRAAEQRALLEAEMLRSTQIQEATRARQEEQRQLQEEAMRSQAEEAANQPPAPLAIPRMDVPTAVPATELFDEQPDWRPPMMETAEQVLQGHMAGAPTAPQRAMPTALPIPMEAPSAVPTPEHAGGDFLPSIPTALGAGALDLAGGLTGLGAMGLEGLRRLTGREEPYEMQQKLFEASMALGEKAGEFHAELNPPLETFKGLFGQSDVVGAAEAYAKAPAMIVEVMAGLLPLQAMTMGTGLIGSKLVSQGLKRGLTGLGGQEFLKKRANKFLMDEAVRAVRADMGKTAWKKASKETKNKIKERIAANINRDMGKKLVDAGAERLGMTGAMFGSMAGVETGFMFQEAAEYMGGMDNVSLGSTALLGSLAGAIEFSFGGGNLKVFRRYLGPKAEKEALQLARRAAVADGAELPALGAKATKLWRRLAQASGEESAQETMQELAAITNMAYNAPESIMDMDIMGRLGGSALVGAIGGLGPAAIDAYITRKSNEPEPTDITGEAVDAPIPEEGAPAYLNIGDLKDDDVKTIKTFGVNRVNYLRKNAKGNMQIEELRQLEHAPEGQEGANYQNPEYLLQRYVNRTGRDPKDALEGLYMQIGRKRSAKVADTKQHDVTKPVAQQEVDSAVPSGDTVFTKKEQATWRAQRAKDLKAQRKAESTSIRKEAEKRSKALFGMSAKYSELATDQDKANYLEDLAEKHLGEGYEVDYANPNRLFNEVAEQLHPISSTLTDAQVAEQEELGGALQLSQHPAAVALRGLNVPSDIEREVARRRGQPITSAIPSGVGGPMLPGRMGAAAPAAREEALMEAGRARAFEGGVDPALAAAIAPPSPQLGPPLPPEMEARRALSGVPEGVAPVEAAPPAKPKKPVAKKAKPTVSTAKRKKAIKEAGETGKEEELKKIAGKQNKSWTDEDKARAIKVVNASGLRAKPLTEKATVKTLRGALNDVLGTRKKGPTVSPETRAKSQQALARRHALRRQYKETFGETAPNTMKTPDLEVALGVAAETEVEAPPTAPVAEPTKPAKKPTKAEKQKAKKAKVKAKAEERKARKEAKKAKKEEKKPEKPAPTAKTKFKDAEELQRSMLKPDIEKKLTSMGLNPVGRKSTLATRLFTALEGGKLEEKDRVSEKKAPKRRGEAEPGVAITEIVIDPDQTIVDARKDAIKQLGKVRSAIEKKATKTDVEKETIKLIKKTIPKVAKAKTIIAIEELVAKKFHVKQPVTEAEREAAVEAEEPEVSEPVPTLPTPDTSKPPKEKKKGKKKKKKKRAKDDEQKPELKEPTDHDVLYTRYQPVEDEGMELIYPDGTVVFWDGEEAINTEDLHDGAQGPMAEVVGGEHIVVDHVDLPGLDFAGRQAGRYSIEMSQAAKKKIRKDDLIAYGMKQGHAHDKLVKWNIGKLEKEFGEGTPGEPYTAKPRKEKKEGVTDPGVEYGGRDISEMVKDILGEDRFDELYPDGLKTPKKGKMASGTLPETDLSGLGLVTDKWEKLTRLVGYQIGFPPKVSQLALEVAVAFAESDGTFTSQALDDHIYGKGAKVKEKPRKRTTKVGDTKLVKTEASPVYSAKTLPKEINRNDVAGRRLWDSERVRVAWAEWMGNELGIGQYEQNIQQIIDNDKDPLNAKPLKNAKLQAVIEKMVRRFNIQAKGILAEAAAPVQSGGGFKSSPGQKPGEREKNMLAWFDEEAIKKSIDKLGHQAVFYNLYKPFIDVLAAARGMMLIEKKKAIQIHEKRPQDRQDAINGMMQQRGMSRQDATLLVDDMLRELRTPANMSYIGDLRRNARFLNKALSMMVEGRAPQKVPPGMWPAIKEIMSSIRATTAEDRINEYSAWSNYLEMIARVAKSKGFSKTFVQARKIKATGEEDVDAAKSLLIDKFRPRWTVIVHKPSDKKWLGIPVDENAKHGRWGHRIDRLNRKVHVAEGHLFSDAEVEDIRATVRQHEFSVEAPELSAEYGASLDKIEDLNIQIRALQNKNISMMRMWEDEGKKVKKEKKASKEYQANLAEIKEKKKEAKVLAKEIDVAQKEYIVKTRKQNKELENVRREELASTVSDEDARKLSTDKDARAAFEASWLKHYTDRYGKRVPFMEWARRPVNEGGLGAHRKITLPMWKVAKGIYDDHVANNRGRRGGENVTLQAMLEEEYVENWWRATDPAIHEAEGRPKAYDELFEDVTITTNKDERYKELIAAGVSKKAANDKLKNFQTVKETKQKIKTLNTEQMNDIIEKALAWEKTRMGEMGATVRAQAIKEEHEALLSRQGLLELGEEKVPTERDVVMQLRSAFGFTDENVLKYRELEEKVAAAPKGSKERKNLLAKLRRMRATAIKKKSIDKESRPNRIQLASVGDETLSFDTEKVAENIADDAFSGLYEQLMEDREGAFPFTDYILLAPEAGKPAKTVADITVDEEIATLTDDMTILRGIASGTANAHMYLAPFTEKYLKPIQQIIRGYLPYNEDLEDNVNEITSLVYADIAGRTGHWIQKFQGRKDKSTGFGVFIKQIVRDSMATWQGSQLREGQMPHVEGKDYGDASVEQEFEAEQASPEERAIAKEEYEDMDDDEFKDFSFHKIVRGRKKLKLAAEAERAAERKLNLKQPMKPVDPLPRKELNLLRKAVEDEAFRRTKGITREEAKALSLLVHESTHPLGLQEKIVSNISKAFGSKVYFIKNLSVAQADGVFGHKNIYLDADSARNNALFIYGHEFWHQIEMYARNNESFANMFAVALSEIKQIVLSTQAGKAAYNAKRESWLQYYSKSYMEDRNKTSLTEAEIDAGTWSEFGGDLTGFALMDREFYDRVEELDPSIGKVVKSVIKNMWRKLLDFTQALYSALTINKMDVQGRRGLGKIALEEKMNEVLPWLSDVTDLVPDKMKEVSGIVARIVTEATKVSVDWGEVKYFKPDQIVSNYPIIGHKSTFKTIGKGILDNNTEVIPVLADLSKKWNPATIRHNIRAAIGELVSDSPVRYLGEYFAANKKLDAMLYPAAYGRTSEVLMRWMRGWADKDLKGKAFGSWFKDSKITNGLMAKMDNNPGVVTDPKGVWAKADPNEPLLMQMTTNVPVHEMLRPEHSISSWTNANGVDRFAFSASVHPGGGLNAKADSKKLSNTEAQVPVYISSKKPFDTGDEYNGDVIEEYWADKYDRFKQKEYEDIAGEFYIENLHTDPGFLEFLDNKGYDSLIHYNGGPHVIVFNAGQVKHTEKNMGSYLFTDNNMYFRLKEDGSQDPHVQELLDLGWDETEINRIKDAYVAGWSMDERYLRESIKRDEADPTIVKKIGGIFASGETDKKWYHDLISNPWHLSELFPKFRKVHKVETTRQDALQLFIHKHSSSLKDSNELHEFLALPEAGRRKTTKALQLGDKYNHELTEDEMIAGEFKPAMVDRKIKIPKLTEQEIEAVKAVRTTLNNVWRARFNSMKAILLRPYLGTDLYLPLRGAVKSYLTMMGREEIPDESAGETVFQRVTHPTKDAVSRLVGKWQGKIAEHRQSDFKDAFENMIRSGGRVEQLFEINDDWTRIKGYFPRMRKSSQFIAEIYTGEAPDSKHVLWSYKPTVMETRNIGKKGSVFEYATLESYMKKHPQFGPMLASGEATFKISRRPQLAEDIFSEVSGADTSGIVRSAIEKMKDKGKVDEELADQIYDALFQQISDQFKARGFGRHSIKRGERFIGGFEEGDGKEIFNSYISGAGGFITKQQASWDFFKAMEGINPDEDPQLFLYSKRFIDNMLRNTDSIDAVSSKMRGAMFTMFLAGSMKPVVVNFTQNFVAGIAVLSGQAGVAKAHKIYLKAMKDVAGIINPITTLDPKGKPKVNKANLTEEEYQYTMKAILQGRTIDQFVRELTESTRMGSQWYHKIANYLSRPFSHMEQFNRAAANLAMFRYAREIGMDPAAADDAAERFVNNTHYLIGKANTPQFAQGESFFARVLAKNALLFRSFTHNYMLSMVRSLDNHNADVNRYTTIMVSFAYIALFGGLLSLPFFDDLLELMEKITKKPLRAQARKAAYEDSSGWMFDAATHGVPSLFGADISGSMRISMPWGPDDAVFGVWGGLAHKMKQVPSAIGVQDYNRALENLAPMFLSHPLRAYRSYKYPVTTPSGQVMRDWEGLKFQYTSMDAFWRVLGFRPTREAVRQLDKRSKTLLIDSMENVRNNIYREYAIAHSKGDSEGMIRAKKKGWAWNKDRLTLGVAKHIPSAMSDASFKRSLKRKIKGRNLVD